jgi:predicted nucleic acid-binding protein
VILVETSAWIEFDRATGSAVDLALTKLITDEVDISVTEPILMEVLAGARNSDSWSRLRRLLTSFSWTPVDSVADFEAAAEIFRDCRSQGITPRGLIDCMIVAVALRTNASVLTADKDFAQIATVVPLSVVQ